MGNTCRCLSLPVFRHQLSRSKRVVNSLESLPFVPAKALFLSIDFILLLVMLPCVTHTTQVKKFHRHRSLKEKHLSTLAEPSKVVTTTIMICPTINKMTKATIPIYHTIAITHPQSLNCQSSEASPPSTFHLFLALPILEGYSAAITDFLHCFTTKRWTIKKMKKFK